MTDHLLIAHGSPDPRHAATMSRLVAAVNERGVRCELAYLEHNTPGVAEWLRTRGATRSGPIAVTGLLLAPGYHAQVDVPQLLGKGPATLLIDDRGPLGLGPWLNPTLDDLVTRFDGTSSSPVIVASAGSSRAEASAYVAEFVVQCGSTRPGSVTFAVATGPGLAVADAIAAASTVDDAAIVLPLMVAHGVLADRIADLADAAGVTVTGTLSDSPAFVDALVSRVGSA